MLDCREIWHAKLPWVAQVLCARKEDGISRLCLDSSNFHSRLVLENGGLDDYTTNLDNVRENTYFTQVDLVEGVSSSPYRGSRQAQDGISRLLW